MLKIMVLYVQAIIFNMNMNIERLKKFKMQKKKKIKIIMPFCSLIMMMKIFQKI